MFRFSLPAYDWERVYYLLPKILQNPQRLGLVASVGLHGVIFLTVLLPYRPEPLQPITETVDLVTLAPEQEALLPSLTPLVPDELPDLSQAIAGLESELAPPPFRFEDLPPLPALAPLPNFSYLPPPVAFPTTPRLSPPQPTNPVPLPPPIRTLPNLPGEVAVAPDLVEPSPTPAPTQPNNAVTSPTADQQALSGLSRWISQARGSIGGQAVGLNFTGKLEAAYPAGACADQLQGRAAVAVLVTPEGRLASTSEASGFGQNPQLIRSTGSALLDQVAVRTVAAQTFPAGEQFQALLYTMDFVYSESVCGQAPSSPSPSPGTTSTPTPSPEASGVPSPASPAARPAPTPKPKENPPPTSSDKVAPDPS